MHDDTVLVTGASSGIGLHLAHEFARHGHRLVLTAPVESELREIAAHMKNVHGVEAHVIAKDLEQPSAAQEIFDELQSHALRVDILVNNAGHGFHGKWWEQPIQQDLSVVTLNIEAVLRLTKLFLPPMLSRGRGRLLNVASVAGFQPGPLMNTYASTKAFVLSWSEALAIELEETPITVTALCPGATDTDFFQKAGAENIKAVHSSNFMSPQEVAKAGYEALMRGDLFYVPGGLNKAMIAARRILPVETQAHMTQKEHSEVPAEQRTNYRGVKEGAHADAEALPGAARK